MFCRFVRLMLSKPGEQRLLNFQSAFACEVVAAGIIWAKLSSFKKRSRYQLQCSSNCCNYIVWEIKEISNGRSFWERVLKDVGWTMTNQQLWHVVSPGTMSRPPPWEIDRNNDYLAHSLWSIVPARLPYHNFQENLLRFKISWSNQGLIGIEKTVSRHSYSSIWKSAW